MQVICELIQLKPGKEKEYINLHNNTWPELIKEIRRVGFIEEYIFMFGQLIIIILKSKNVVESKNKLAKAGVYNRLTKIVQSMLIFDKELFQSNKTIIDLKPIWNLNDFDKEGKPKTACNN